MTCLRALLLCTLVSAAACQLPLNFKEARGLCYDTQGCSYTCAEEGLYGGSCSPSVEGLICWCRNYEDDVLGECMPTFRFLHLFSGGSDHHECGDRCARKGWLDGSCWDGQCRCTPHIKYLQDNDQQEEPQQPEEPEEPEEPEQPEEPEEPEQPEEPEEPEEPEAPEEPIKPEEPKEPEEPIEPEETTETEPSPQKKSFNIYTSMTLNWFQAGAKCREMGMFLATIDSEEDQYNIEQEVEFNNMSAEDLDCCSDHDIWTSGSNLGNTDYVWMSSGQYIEYSNWDEKRTKSDTENEKHCLQLMTPSLKWGAQDCLVNQYFVCQYYN